MWLLEWAWLVEEVGDEEAGFVEEEEFFRESILSRSSFLLCFMSLNPSHSSEFGI